MPFTTVKRQNLEHLRMGGRKLYMAMKDLIDQINLHRIIKENASLFRRLSNPKKKRVTEDQLFKRMITMFLPDHKKSLWYLKNVLKHCYLVHWDS